MKYIITVSLLLQILIHPQIGNREKLEEIKSKRDINIIKESDDVYLFKHPDSRLEHKYLGKKVYPDTVQVPTTIIDTWNIDTTLYTNMYTFWQEILVSTSSTYELTIGDANENGYPEIYGYSKDYDEPPGQPPEIFEMDSTGNFFRKHVFDDSVRAVRAIHAIKNRGSLDILTRGNSGYKLFYHGNTPSSLPIIIDFIFSPFPGQIDDPKFGDFDKNDKTDLIFYADPYRSSVICEYDSVTNNFNVIYEIHDTIGYYQGYAIGDFDLDGKTDIVYGGIEGEVIVIEAEQEHIYSRVWQTNMIGSNSFMQMFTNDVDKNGKPEFWISSTTDNGINDITRFACFEFVADNNYKEIYRIDFSNIFPFLASNCFPVDVDKDSTEELIICLDDHLFILKFEGSPNNPNYEIFYMRRKNLLNGAYFGATMYDLDSDGFEELLIHQAIGRDDGNAKDCTLIYKPDFMTSIIKDNYNLARGYILEQNYPNPFNPLTSVSYYLPEASYISLNVFDVLGNEIIQLDEGDRQRGEHIINWNGKDKFQRQLSSGIYFIQLETPAYNKTIKGVLLK